MLTDELLTFLFDGQSHLLAELMGMWLASSRRFTAFVTTYQTKIRKKIRIAQEPESLRDLQLELETAYLLLREKSLNVAHETQHPREGRSPDFAVSFTTSLELMVEVTRLRAPNTISTIPPFDDRFSDMLGSKLGQLLPQRSNVLIAGMETPFFTHADLNTVMLRVQKRAEGNDPGIVQRHGFRDRADFFHHYQHLSAILLREIPLQFSIPVIFWENSQTKHPLPGRVRTALLRSHTL